MANINSYKNKIMDFGFRDGSFTNDSGEQQEYTQLVIVYELGGDIEELVISGKSAPKPDMIRKLLKGAKNVENGMLGDDRE